MIQSARIIEIDTALCLATTGLICLDFGYFDAIDALFIWNEYRYHRNL